MVLLYSSCSAAMFHAAVGVCDEVKTGSKES